MMRETFAVPTWSLGPTGPPLSTATYASSMGVDSTNPPLYCLQSGWFELVRKFYGSNN